MILPEDGGVRIELRRSPWVMAKDRYVRRKSVMVSGLDGEPLGFALIEIPGAMNPNDIDVRTVTFVDGIATDA